MAPSSSSFIDLSSLLSVYPAQRERRREMLAPGTFCLKVNCNYFALLSLNIYFSKNKDIFLQSHSTVINIWKFNTDGKKSYQVCSPYATFFQAPGNVLPCCFFPGPALTQVLISLHSSILNGPQPLLASWALDVCKEYRSVILLTVPWFGFCPMSPQSGFGYAFLARSLHSAVNSSQGVMPGRTGFGSVLLVGMFGFVGKVASAGDLLLWHSPCALCK